MMKFFLLLILTRYAVKCDDTSNYYVVEVPEEEPAITELEPSTTEGDPTTAATRARKPFEVYWNVPTMQCKSKKILFNLEEYGIIQNKGDSFRGENIAILYDPGLFPALLKNESSGELKFRNGGVPQEGNMTLHLDAFRTTLEQSIPDENFSGVGIIDFESWRPVFRQNFGVLVPYKDVSYEIERKLHWWWVDDWIQTEAKQRFEAAARSFMQTTLSVAKQMRPGARWGYYGFPYCFNMGANNKVEQCADNVNKENDGTYWLWSESTALYPSVYSSSDLSSAQLAALIRGRVKEANRVRRKSTPVLPYFWFRYRDAGFLSDMDLSTALKAFYTSNASGFIIWGSSNDVNTVEKCQNLLKYVQNTLGPAIAKYTKANTREDDEMLSTTEIVASDTESSGSTNNTFLISDLLYTSYTINDNVKNTTIVNTRFIPIDPDFPWEPPANYSQEISHYVEDELIKKEGYNETKIIREDAKFNRSLLMEIILNNIMQPILQFEDNLISRSAMTNNVSDNVVESTTDQFVGDSDILTSTNQYNFTQTSFIRNIATKNPLEHVNDHVDLEPINYSTLLINGTSETTEYLKEIQTETTKSIFYSDSTTDPYSEFRNQNVREPNLLDDTLVNSHDIIIDTTEGTTEVITSLSDFTSTFDSTDVFYDDKMATELDEIIYSPTEIKNIALNAITEKGDFYTETVAEFITGRADVMKQMKKESIGLRNELTSYNSTDSPTSGRSEPDQVNGSANFAIGSKYFICIMFFYFCVCL